MPTPNIVVLGAGVAGLQTVISLLEANTESHVTIIAQHFPGDKSILYTSPWAGAQWRTHASRDDAEQQTWDIESYKYWLDLIEQGKGDEAGLRVYESKFYWWHPDAEVPDGDAARVWFAPHMRGFKVVEKGQLPEGAWAGCTYQSIMVNVPMYLQYLMRRATSLGANVIRAQLTTATGLFGAIQSATQLLPRHLKQVDIWVNATGLGSRKLVPDESMFPIRGQTVIVKGEALCITTVEDRNPTSPNVTYILPRPGGGTSVLGGTKQVGNWQAEPDGDTTKHILTRAKRWAPELLTGRGGNFEVLDVAVGLRPGRKGGARVEVERLRGGQTICHAYGHAGAGYQNSIGSARKVVNLVESELKRNDRANL